MERFPDPPPLKERAKSRILQLRRRPTIHVASIPYLDDKAMVTWQRLLYGCTSYLEYGSGGSTVAASATEKPVFSLETDKNYLAAVRRAVGDRAQVRLEWVDIGPVGAWGIPKRVVPNGETVTVWSRYPWRPWKNIHQDHLPLPDFVLVDGRFRVASALVSLIEMGPTGFVMVDDYSSRPEYWVLEALSDLVETSGRSAVFRAKRESHERLRLAVEEYVYDWR